MNSSEHPDTFVTFPVVARTINNTVKTDEFCPLCQFLPHYGLNIFRKPLLRGQLANFQG